MVFGLWSLVFGLWSLVFGHPIDNLHEISLEDLKKNVRRSCSLVLFLDNETHLSEVRELILYTMCVCLWVFVASHSKRWLFASLDNFVSPHLLLLLVCCSG